MNVLNFRRLKRDYLVNPPFLIKKQYQFGRNLKFITTICIRYNKVHSDLSYTLSWVQGNRTAFTTWMIPFFCI